MLIHDDGGIVLCDFAGSGMEGIPPIIGAGVRYSDPQRSENMYSTKEDDIFALGLCCTSSVLGNGSSMVEVASTYVDVCATGSSPIYLQSRCR